MIGEHRCKLKENALQNMTATIRQGEEERRRSALKWTSEGTEDQALQGSDRGAEIEQVSVLLLLPLLLLPLGEEMQSSF